MVKIINILSTIVPLFATSLAIPVPPMDPSEFEAAEAPEDLTKGTPAAVEANDGMPTGGMNFGGMTGGQGMNFGGMNFGGMTGGRQGGFGGMNFGGMGGRQGGRQGGFGGLRWYDRR